MALRSAPLAAFVVAGIGVYELTPFKRACLRRCHADERVREQASGAGLAANLACGVRQGIVCVGCCWALMALLFVAGAMNVVWIAAIALFVTAQKLLPLRAA
jgi:predicted metal-binding membrane protein